MFKLSGRPLYHRHYVGMDMTETTFLYKFKKIQNTGKTL